VSPPVPSRPPTTQAGDPVRAAPRADRSPALAATLLALLAAAAAISPQLESGFLFDDTYGSTVRGAALLHDTGLAGLVVRGLRGMLQGQGRWIPLSSVSAVPLYFLDRLAYKASIVALVLANAALFALLLRRLSGSRRTALLFLALLAPFLQLARGPDAILGYHWLLQFVLLYSAGMLLSALRYLETGRRRHLAASVALHACAVLTYEVSYPFFVLPSLLAWAIGKRDVRGSARLCLPYLGVTLAAAASVLAARAAFGLPVAGPNAAYVPATNPFAALLTLARQCSAALPLSCLFSKPGWGVGAIGPADLLREAASRWQVSLLAVLSAGYAAFLAARGDDVAVRRRAPVWLGALFVVLPGVLLSTSPKYQDPKWVDWGAGYLPVYLSWFGAAALAALALGAVRALRTSVPARAAFALAVGLSCATVHAHNSLVVHASDEWRYARDLAEDALRAGLMRDVPAESFLVVDSELPPLGNPSFFRMFHERSLRKVAWPGTLLGGRMTGWDITGEVIFPTGVKAVPLPKEARVGRGGGTSLYRFREQDSVWYFRHVPQPGGAGGVVVLAELAALRSSERAVSGAAAKRALVFAEDDSPEALSLRAHWFGASDLQPRATARIPLSAFAPLARGERWGVFGIAAQDDDWLLDVRSLGPMDASLPASRFDE